MNHRLFPRALLVAWMFFAIIRSAPVCGQQTIIPRERGTLTGSFSATASTARLKVPAVIVTEGYGAPISQWHTGTTKPGHGPAVLKPVLRDVTITGDGVNGRPSDNFLPSGDKLPDKYHGVLMNASGALVDNLHCWNIPGTAGSFYRPNNPRDGQLTAHDRVEHSLTRLSAYRVFRGFDIGCVDGCARDVKVADFRDYGIRIGGSIDFSDVHAYGGLGPGILVAGNNNRGRGLVGENSGVGVQVDGNGNVIAQVRAFDNRTAALVINGKRNRVSDLQIDVSTGVGVHVMNQVNTLAGGWVEAKGESTCVVLGNGTGQRVDLTLIMYGQANATGLVAAVPLKYSRIELLVEGGRIGADFSAGIGPGCDIRIRTRDTVNAVQLPATWNKSSEVIINGVRRAPAK